jgi:hypothetical protein
MKTRNKCRRESDERSHERRIAGDAINELGHCRRSSHALNTRISAASCRDRILDLHAEVQAGLDSRGRVPAAASAAVPLFFSECYF